MQPLAIVFYERLMPGSQLVNRLQDLNYRVLALDNAARLTATVQREMPLLLLADLAAKGEILEAIKKIKVALQGTDAGQALALTAASRTALMMLV